MTAEEFYKDHFGHTSQHVSMDKIFVCMELYARYQSDMDAPEPNDKLKEAAIKYKDTIKETKQ